MSKRRYISPWRGEGTEQSPREPVLCAVFSGNWGSEPGPTNDSAIVIADTTEAEHAAIMALDGVSEVAE